MQTQVYRLPNISFNLTHLNSLKLSISSFKYSLKIFALLMFTYSVLLQFNFKHCFLFLCRDFSKSQCCYFVLLQTRQFDINIQRATILILMNFKNSQFKEFQRANILRTYGLQFLYLMICNVEMSRRSVGK